MGHFCLWKEFLCKMKSLSFRCMTSQTWKKIFYYTGPDYVRNKDFSINFLSGLVNRVFQKVYEKIRNYEVDIF